MREHLHREFDVAPGDVIEVMSDDRADVALLSADDYALFKAGEAFRYFGHFCTEFPARVSPPHAGAWHVVVDLGLGPATPHHSLRVVKGG